MNTDYINILLQECFKTALSISTLAQLASLGRSRIK